MRNISNKTMFLALVCKTSSWKWQKTSKESCFYLNFDLGAMHRPVSRESTFGGSNQACFKNWRHMWKLDGTSFLMRYYGLNLDTWKAVKSILEIGGCTSHCEGELDRKMKHLTICLISQCFSLDLIFILGNKLFTDVIDIVNVIMVFLLLPRVNKLDK